MTRSALRFGPGADLKAPPPAVALANGNLHLKGQALSPVAHGGLVQAVVAMPAVLLLTNLSPPALVMTASAAVLLFQDGRIHIEKISATFPYQLKAGATEFGAGIVYAVEKGWLMLHESGTCVKLLAPGEDLLASQ
ncbi:hypothetical protein ABIA45_000361 [Bradyrhizobium sp. USDA 336]